ncbi:hypothetical protein ACMV5I_25700 [Serratia sp. T13T92]|jgi:hypothetical protein|uniref:hypothetical protein n=1 Tax=Serratia sp. T13T92 TaxID=3397496 RepID=UPI0039E0FA3E
MPERLRKNGKELPEHVKTGGDQVIYQAIVMLRDIAKDNILLQRGLDTTETTRLLHGCYGSMEAFKRLMDYIYQQHPRYFRFAKCIERLAQGIVDGVIELSKDH